MSTQSNWGLNGGAIQNAFELIFSYLLSNANHTFTVDGNGNVKCNNLNATGNVAVDGSVSANGTIVGDSFQNSNLSFTVDSSGNETCESLNVATSTISETYQNSGGFFSVDAGGNVDCNTLDAVVSVTTDNVYAQNVTASSVVNAPVVNATTQLVTPTANATTVNSTTVNVTTVNASVVDATTEVDTPTVNAGTVNAITVNATVQVNTVNVAASVVNASTSITTPTVNSTTTNATLVQIATSGFLGLPSGMPCLQPMSYGQVNWSGTAFTLNTSSSSYWNYTFIVDNTIPACGIVYIGPTYTGQVQSGPLTTLTQPIQSFGWALTQITGGATANGLITIDRNTVLNGTTCSLVFYTFNILGLHAGKNFFFVTY